MNATKSRVVLIDDHPIVLAGIRSIIESSEDFELAGTASAGSAGLKTIIHEKPALAVVDLSMPSMNGVELVQLISQSVPSTMVVVLTVHEEPAYVQQAMSAGARGYVLKRSAADELLRALRAVLANGLYIDPAVAGKLLASFSRSANVSNVLSEREEEVMKAAALGFSNKEIAFRLGLSVKTVETYKTRAMDKLSFRTRAELVRYATAQGWMQGN